MRTHLLVAIACAMSAPLHAQWLNQMDTELLDYHCNDNEKSAPHMVGK